MKTWKDLYLNKEITMSPLIYLFFHSLLNNILEKLFKNFKMKLMLIYLIVKIPYYNFTECWIEIVMDMFLEKIWYNISKKKTFLMVNRPMHLLKIWIWNLMKWFLLKNYIINCMKIFLKKIYSVIKKIGIILWG